MKPWWHFFITLMVFLTFGMANAPRICIGDGQGGACRMEACACVAACTCQAAHAQERREQVEAHAASCCSTGACPAPQAEASSCHQPGSWPHFAPADRHWFALVPTVPAPSVWGDVPGHPTGWAPLPPRAGPRFALEKPPRSFA